METLAGSLKKDCFYTIVFQLEIANMVNVILHIWAYWEFTRKNIIAIIVVFRIHLLVCTSILFQQKSLTEQCGNDTEYTSIIHLT